MARVEISRYPCAFHVRYACAALSPRRGRGDCDKRICDGNPPAVLSGSACSTRHERSLALPAATVPATVLSPGSGSKLRRTALLLVCPTGVVSMAVAWSVERRTRVSLVGHKCGCGHTSSQPHTALLRQVGPRAFLRYRWASLAPLGALAHLRPPLAGLGSRCCDAGQPESAAHTTANGHLLAALASLLFRGGSHTTSLRIVLKQRRNLRL